MVTAAVALNAGVADPIAFLALTGDDWDIGCAVVRKARAMQLEQRREELKAVIRALSDSIGNRVAEQLAKIFR